jgi:aldehyde:ferredoxin oxidoreductase
MAITAKILHVDLTARTHRAEEIPEATYRKYLGGGALAAHLVLREMKAGAEPLGPDKSVDGIKALVDGTSVLSTAALPPLFARSALQARSPWATSPASTWAGASGKGAA